VLKIDVLKIDVLKISVVVQASPGNVTGVQVHGGKTEAKSIFAG
jgi:hypothetical protein